MCCQYCSLNIVKGRKHINIVWVRMTSFNCNFTLYDTFEFFFQNFLDHTCNRLVVLNDIRLTINLSPHIPIRILYPYYEQNTSTLWIKVCLFFNGILLEFCEFMVLHLLFFSFKDVMINTSINQMNQIPVKVGTDC